MLTRRDRMFIGGIVFAVAGISQKLESIEISPSLLICTGLVLLLLRDFVKDE